MALVNAAPMGGGFGRRQFLKTAAGLAGAAMLLIVTGLAVWQARRRPYLLVGWLWFVGSLVPVIGVFVFFPTAPSVVSPAG